MTIAHLTDLHIDSETALGFAVDTRGRFETVLDDLLHRGISTVVLTGDLSEPSGYEWLFSRLNGAGLEYHICFGNHDARSALTRYCRHGETETPYRMVTFGGRPTFMLDSSTTRIDPAQTKWLLKNAEGIKDPVIFMHHPPLDCGSTPMDLKYPLEERKRFASALNGLDGVVSVLCGHYHWRHEINEGNIRQYVAPSTCLQIDPTAKSIEFDKSFIGYGTVEIDPEKLLVQAISIKTDKAGYGTP